MSDLRKEFDEFDRANPAVWKMFVRFALEAIRAGRTELSASLVVERIRWETTVVTTDAEFKVNNNHRAYYARKFNELYPNAGGKFSTRAVAGEEEPRFQPTEEHQTTMAI